jgi:hypothetical protein
MSDAEFVEILRTAGSKSNAHPQSVPMRVLLRVALTLLLAIPVCLALAVFVALEARRAVAPPLERTAPNSSARRLNPAVATRPFIRREREPRAD